MKNSIALLVACAPFGFLTGCTTDLKIPEDAKIACATDEECPSGYYCNKFLAECKKTGAGDTEPPGIAAGSARVTPAFGTTGTEINAVFEATEELSGPPVVKLDVPGNRAMLVADQDGLKFSYRYVTTGSEPVGKAKVLATLLDTSGNRAADLPVGEVVFDFTSPRPTSVAARDAGPLKAGVELVIEVVVDEELSSAPAVTLLPGEAAFELDLASAAPQYVYKRVLTGDEAAGEVGVRVSLTDAAGNTGTNDFNALAVLDFARPEISDFELLTEVVGAAGTLSAWAKASENLSTPPTLLISSGATTANVAAVRKPGGEYSFSAAAADLGIPDGTYDVTVTAFADAAGNPGGDKALGTLTLDTVAPSQAAGEVAGQAVLGSGAAVTVTVTLDEPAAVTLRAAFTGGQSRDLGASKQDAEGRTWAAGFTTGAGDPQGEVQFWADAVDAAGNRSVAILVGSRKIDLSAPSISAPVATPFRLRAGAATSISFTVSEELPAAPAVTVAGTPATLSSQVGAAYVFSYTATGAEMEGEAAVSVVATDGAGNAAQNDTAKVVFDFTNPALTVTPAKAALIQGEMLSVQIDAQEDLIATPVLTGFNVAGSCWQSAQNRRYDCTITVPAAEAPGAKEIMARGIDLVGNGGEAVSPLTVNPAGGKISNLMVSPALAKAGTAVSITFDVPKTPDAEPYVTVAGEEAACTATGLSYACAYTPAGSEGDGQQPVIVMASFDGRAAQAQRTVTLDFTPPALGSVSVSPAYAGRGATVQVSLSFAETLSAPPALSLAGEPLGAGACAPAGAARSYTCAYTSSTAAAGGAAALDIAATDMAGNVLNVPAYPSGLTLDFTPPDITVTANPPEPKKGQPINFDVNTNEPLGAAPEINASFVSGFVFCSGPVPGSRFTCTGAVVSDSAPIGSVTFTAKGSDRAANEATSPAGSATVGEPAGGPAIITFNSVAPNPIREGNSVTIAFSANQTLSACGATVAGQAATCGNPVGKDCSCTFTISLSVPEGGVGVIASGTNSNGTGSSPSYVLQVDKTPPQISGGSLTIVRSPVGTVDRFSAAAGAIRDDGRDLYTGRGVTMVKVWDAESGGTPLFTVASPDLGADGSFAARDLPGTVATGLKQVWVTAVDIPGNESTRSEALVGTDKNGPVGNGSLMSFVRRDLSQKDGVSGSAGAFTDAVSALREVAIYDAGSGGNKLGTLTPDANGGFPELLIGTPTSSYGRLWADAEDKCGNRGERVEVLVGKDDPDSGAPTGNDAFININRRDLTQRDGVSGSAGAFADATSVLKEIRVYDQDWLLLGAATPSADGSFPEILIGTPTSSYGRVKVTAIDKCGNVSAPVDPPSGRDEDTLPSGNGALITINRKDLTQPDTVLGAANAFWDPVSVLREVLVYDAEFEGTGNLVATVTPLPDGSFPEVATGTATSSYCRLWLRAVDKCGQSTGRIEALDGRDLSPPIANGDLVTINRKNLTQPDTVSGAAGAVSDTVSAVREVRVWDTGTSVPGVNPIGSATPLPDGSFPEIPVGIATASYKQLWFTAVDKCGNMQGKDPGEPLYEVGNGADLAPPSLDGLKLTFSMRPASSNDGLSGAAGAVTDVTSAVKEILVYESAGAPSTLIPAFGVDAGGGFSERNVGDTSLDRVYVSALDKAGNVSNRVYSRKVQATFNTAGKVPHQASPAPVAVYAFDADFDPRTASPGLGPTLVDELDAAGYAATAAANGTRHTASALTETATTTAAWKTYAPTPRKQYAMTYDSGRGKVVLFGGYSDNHQNDTWEWDGATGRWTDRTPAGAKPSIRYGAAMAYDPIRGKVVLFGGNGTGPVYDDTWEWDGAAGTWTNVAPATTTPTERFSHAMTFDGKRGKVLMNGGRQSGAGTHLDDTWEWNGADWTDVTPGGTKPGARSGHAMAYDAFREKVVLFGGDSGAFLWDTWEWNGQDGSWAEVVPGQSPQPRMYHAMAYDSARQRVLIFAGSQNGARVNDMWEWDGAAYVNVTPAGTKPVPRWFMGLAFDGARGKALTFGGQDDGGEVLGDTWEWDGTAAAWIDRTPAGGGPGGRYSTGFAYDSLRQKTVIHGGYSFGSVKDDLWTWDSATLAWSKLIPTGGYPLARHSHAMTYDARRDKTFLFGGSEYNDSWEFDPMTAAWTKVEPGGTPEDVRPPTGGGFPMVYDPARGASALFGARAEDPDVYIWEWSPAGQAWQSWETPTLFQFRFRDQASMAYDSVRGTTVLFGGHDQSGNNLNATWEWDAASHVWVNVTPAGAKPTTRFGQRMVYDPRRGVTVLFGGDDGAGTTNLVQDTWEWNGATGSWTEVGITTSKPKARSSHAMTYDAARGTVQLFGGYVGGTSSIGDVWEFTGASSPHARHAAESAGFEVPDGSTITALTAKWVGAGSGDDQDNPGVWTPGVHVYIWDWRGGALQTGAWEWLGSNVVPVASCDEPAGQACTITGTPSGPVANYMNSGKIWLMAVAGGASSEPPGAAITSEVHTDYVELQAGYTLP